MNLLYLLLVFLVQSRSTAYANPVVSVDNLDLGLGGNVKVQVFDESILTVDTAQPIMEKTVAASAEALPVKLEALPEGRYMIAVLHDSNGNGKLDYSFFGVPKEGYGFSGKFLCKQKSPRPSLHFVQLSEGLQHVKVHLCY